MDSIDWSRRAHAGVALISPYEPGKPVAEVEREYGVADAVKLASNENPLGPSERVRAALVAALGDVGRYPDGAGFVLRERLAASLAVEPSMITLGSGSNEVIDLVARAFLTPGCNAVMSQYGFVAYMLSTRASGAELRLAPAHQYGHDPEALLAAIDATTRVVFLANPNNPTGTWLRREPLTAFLRAVPPEVVVLLDQAYFEYFDDADYLDGMDLLATFPNLIVTRTFSKIHGLAAMRVGYGVSSPALADLLNRVRLPFNVSTPAQAAAVAAIDDSGELVGRRAANQAGLDQLRGGFAALDLPMIEGHGNFLAVDVCQLAGPVHERLLRQGVIVRPIGAYGLPNHLRVTVGTASQNERALAAFAQVL